MEEVRRGGARPGAGRPSGARNRQSKPKPERVRYVLLAQPELSAAIEAVRLPAETDQALMVRLVHQGLEFDIDLHRR